MKYKVFFLLFFLVTIIFLVSFKALADNNIQVIMEEMKYSILPEYDRHPDVLVIYSGTLVNNSNKTFNGELKYKVPKNAEIKAVCETEEGMLCLKYTVKTDQPDYDVVVWEPSHPLKPGEKLPVMMEYYHKPFKSGVNTRKFTQIFRPAFPIKNLTVEINLPPDSKNIKLQPKASVSNIKGKGIKSYSYEYSNLMTNSKHEFSITYVRSSNKPFITSESLSLKRGANESGLELPVNKSLVILFAIFSLILVLILFYGIYSNNKNTRKPAE